MRSASGHQGENDRAAVKKNVEQEHVRHFLHKTCNQEVSGSFTLQSCKATANKCTKEVCCTCKIAFLLIRPIAVFFIDCNLNFSDHINSVTKKDSQRASKDWGSHEAKKPCTNSRKATTVQSGHTTSSNLLPFNLAHVTRENWSAFKKEGLG